HSFASAPVIDSTRSLSLFSSWPTNGHDLWCFLFVTLFNLQGAGRSRRVLITVPQKYRLVNNFFEILF
ncbi:hypothetical protein, partial [uncultured Oscillibacter sp.]|uniref:hypothetical protein n=1 Tax=uncultured Oscillibacter sp. TaxID=876091 RepID=UPI00262A1CEF